MSFDGVEELTRPTSLAEAWAQKEEGGEEARFIASGIDLAVFAPPSVKRLIDLGGLGLSYVREEDGGIGIGTTTTMTEIGESPLVQGYAGGFLATVIRRVASPLQRNLATFGGTLGTLHPWSDIVPALLVLDADLVVYDGEKGVVPLSDYLKRRGEGFRPLITEIRLPRISDTAGAAFEKFTRTRFDIGLLNCACFVELRDGRCETLRIAIGGRPAIATRLGEIEGEWEGGTFNREAIERIAGLAAERADLRDDLRASAGYRRTLAKVGVKRCLERIAEGLEGGDR